MAKVKSGVCQGPGRAKRESARVRLPRLDSRAVPRVLSNLSASQRGGMDEKKNVEGRSYRQHGISLSFSMESVSHEVKGGVCAAQ